MRHRIAARRSRRLYQLAGVGLLAACGGDDPLGVGKDLPPEEWVYDQYVAVGRTIELDLVTIFSSLDSVTLRFHAETSDPSLVTVAIDDGVLTLESVGGEGSTDVTVWATAPRGRSAVADFAVFTDFGGSIELAAAASVGDTIQGVLGRGDEDYFEVSVPTDAFRLRAFTQGDTAPVGALYDANGTRIARDHDTGEGLNFYIIRELNAGTHYLSVSGWDTGSYSLIVEEAGTDDHGDSFATATPVSIGDTVPGVLTPGDEDYFEFSVSADGSRLGVFTQGTTDAVGTLYDGNGSRLADDADSGEGDNFHIIRTLDAGRYYLRVFGSYHREAGYYSLILREAEPDDHGNTIATATSVSIGDTVPGILAARDRDFFEFSVPTDGFRLGAFTQGDTDTDGVLYDRSGSWIAHDYSSGEGSNFHVTRVLDAGTYYLEVSGGGGSYLLILEEGGTDAAGSARDTGRPGVAAVPPQGAQFRLLLTSPPHDALKY